MRATKKQSSVRNNGGFCWRWRNAVGLSSVIPVNCSPEELCDRDENKNASALCKARVSRAFLSN